MTSISPLAGHIFVREGVILVEAVVYQLMFMAVVFVVVAWCGVEAIFWLFSWLFGRRW